MAETWTCSLRQRGFTNSRYFTRKVIASIHLTPPLPFVLKGERGQGGEGRAAACSTPPRRCKGTLLCDQFCATSASNSSGRIVPAWTLPTAARSPSSPGPFSPNEYIGEKGDLRFEWLRNSRCPHTNDSSTVNRVVDRVHKHGHWSLRQRRYIPEPRCAAPAAHSGSHDTS